MRPACLVIVTGALACQQAGESSTAKRTPVPPPPAHVEIPAGLAIPVEVDGVAAAPIDAARLTAIAPDFVDPDRRAWRLSGLLGAPAARDGAVIEAIGASGVAITMRRPRAATDPQPVLTLTRRGELAAALVPADDPFPEYHGRGGRLKRPGDPLPRIMPVARIRVYVEAAGAGGEHRQAAAGALAGLRITVAGQAAPAWTADRVGAIKTLAMETEGGAQQDAWSLRDLAHALVGPNARVVALTGEDGARLAIEPAVWADAARTPVLRANRRGLLKLQWLAAGGALVGADELRGVTGIELEP